MNDKWVVIPVRTVKDKVANRMIPDDFGNNLLVVAVRLEEELVNVIRCFDFCEYRFDAVSTGMR